MDPSAIFAPFFAMIALTFVVWLYMYSRRIPFLIRNKVDLDNVRPADIERSAPPELLNPSSNLKNLFEVPVIFYAVCLYLFVTGQVDETSVVSAWIFVGFRILHSVEHCTRNKALPRFGLYMVSTFALWFMVFREIFSYFLVT